MFDVEYFFRTFWLSFKALPVTLKITAVSFSAGTILGFMIALCRIHRTKAASQICAFFVSFIRGTPVVLQVLVVYSIIPSFLNSALKNAGSSIDVFSINPIVYAYIVFSLNNTAVLSEVFRSALLTVSKGQLEAGLACGLTKCQTFTRIIIPQALESALPNICNATINLIKNTSLAFMMTVKDVTAVARIEASYGYNYIESYLDIFLIYVIACSLVQQIFRLAERKVSAYRKY